MKNKERLKLFFTNVFNWKFAVMAALFNGFLVAFLNFSHGATESSRAGLVQVVVNFVAGGVGARIIQHFATMSSKFLSYFLSSALSISIKLGLAMVAHEANNTPEYWLSTLLPVGVSCFTSVAVNYGTRNLQNLKIVGWIFRPPRTKT